MTTAYLVIIWRACGGSIAVQGGTPERVGGTVKPRGGVRVFAAPNGLTYPEDMGSLRVHLERAAQHLPAPPPTGALLDPARAYQWCLDYGFSPEEAQALTGGGP